MARRAMTAPLFFDSVRELRAWAAQHARTVGEAWVGFHRAGTAGTGVTFAEAADELAEIGWVDSGRRIVDNDRYAVLFAPGKVARRPAEPTMWRGEGQAEMPALDPAYEAQFRADPAAWEFFVAQTPGYRRTAIWWVMSGKKDETRARRLAALIEGSAARQRLPQLQRIR